MNKGKIKWNVNLTATINGDVTDSDYAEQLSEMIKSVEKFNDEINKSKPSEMIKSVEKFNDEINKSKPFGKNTKGIDLIKSDNPNETILDIKFDTEINSPYVFNDSFEGIKNSMKWFNTVLDDRDWDFRHITNVLKFKIQNTCDYMKKKQGHLDWERNVKYMNIAINLIKKIWGDEYGEETVLYDSEYTNYHVIEWNWIPISNDEIKEMEKDINENIKFSKRIEVTEISNNFDEFFEKNKLMHKKAIEYIKINKSWNEPESKYVQSMIISKLKHQKAINLLFKILSSNLEKWWY